jgi:hypothetical protein
MTPSLHGSSHDALMPLDRPPGRTEYSGRKQIVIGE